MTLFKQFNLHDDLIHALEKVGFSSPTGIQEEFIPEALKGGDVMASAQTGSGKTAAFLLPTFQKILEDNQKRQSKNSKHVKFGPRALILTPTRELAEQILKVSNDLKQFTKLNVQCVTGGVPIFKHKRMLKNRIDVLIATPGRLIDLMNQRDVLLHDVETLTLDEADRMLDMGFIHDVTKIADATPETRQTFLLSATFDGNIKKIISQLMTEPKTIELTHVANKHENIEQCMYRAADRTQKVAMLDTLVEDPKIWQGVIFTNNKHFTEKLAKHLKGKGEKVDVLHGDMRQNARNVSMKRMQAGQVRFLVATDVAARGLDIKELTHVINFDLPLNSEDYIHRIGRVGRGGKEGHAISLISDDQRHLLGRIEKMLQTSISEQTLEEHTYTPSAKSSKPSSKGKGGNASRPKRQGGGSNFKRGANKPQEEQGRQRKSFGERRSQGEGNPRSRVSKPDGKSFIDSKFSGEKPQKSTSFKRKPTDTSTDSRKKKPFKAKGFKNGSTHNKRSSTNANGHTARKTGNFGAKPKQGVRSNA